MTSPIAALPIALSNALKGAAGRAGVSFDFMVRTATRESGLDSTAKAATSSAAGLFQFIEQTWLNMVSRHGGAHGLGVEAKAITEGNNGRLEVNDAATRERILNLRFDPKVSAQMVGELTRENAAVLQQHLGRKPEEAELYIAHFMGAGQASALINAGEITPGANAAIMFPKAASANRPIFFEASGKARSTSEVLTELKRAHGPNESLTPAKSTNGAVNAPSAQAANAGSAALSAVSAFGPHPQSLRAFGAPILHLTPAIMQILAELSVPQSADTSSDETRKENPVQKN